MRIPATGSPVNSSLLSLQKCFRTYGLSALHLLLPSLQDWLPEDHLAHFVGAVTSELALSAIEPAYKRACGRGKPAYHPLLPVRLLVCGDAIGMRRSRQVEKVTYTDLAFRYLAADQHPGHDTIAAFRQTHRTALGQLFLQPLLLCQKAGLIKLCRRCQPDLAPSRYGGSFELD